MRVENDVPSNELWLKYPSSAISRECCSAAAVELRVLVQRDEPVLHANRVQLLQHALVE